MLEKNVRLLIFPLLLSAALSFAACSALSEDVPSDTSTPLLVSGEPSEDSEKISESEQESASEDTERTSAEEITTPHEAETDTAQQETRQSSDTAPNLSDTALGATSPQTDGTSYSQPVSENSEKSVAEPFNEQDSEAVSPPVSTTTFVPETAPVTQEATVPQTDPPMTTEPAATVPTTTEAVLTSVSDSVSEPAPVASEPTAESPPDPALTGGRYEQRYCTEKELDFADKVFELTNAERAKNGLAPFEKMDILKNVALTRAWELTVEYRADHTRPDGTTCTGAFNENGIIYGGWGENIAAGQDSPESVVDAWMNSPSHRAAILNKDYTYMGVGYYYIENDHQSYYHFWTQEFYHY